MKKSLSVVSSRSTAPVDRDRDTMTSRKAVLGTGPDGVPVEVDIDALPTSRALIQANSGFGKSWLLRRLLEQSHGLVQQLIIDPDGDFVTLRERFDDYVIVAVEDGDLLADPQTARLLGRQLIMANVSAVLDLSDVQLADRICFVDELLRGVMQAPRSAWHPVLVVIDEAHEFAPQQGAALSKRAVIDLMTRGRKRGYGGILATQRLASLDKNAAAQAANRLIGRCSMETDRRRAAYELGLGRRQQVVLSELVVGEFCAQGPAISNEMVRVKVGGVETSHGSREGARQPVRPSPALAEVLPQLIEALRASGSSVESDQRDGGGPTPNRAIASEKPKGRGRTVGARREAGTGDVDGASRIAKSRTDGEHRPAIVREPVENSVLSWDAPVRASIGEQSGDVEITIRIAYPRR